MSTLQRARTALKVFAQLGPAPLLLQTVYRLGLITGHFRRLEAASLATGRAAPRIARLVLRLPTSQELSRVLSAGARSTLLREANAVAAGKMRLFGGVYAPIQLVFEGTLRHWTEYELHRLPLPPLRNVRWTKGRHRPADPPADIKFLWEPARFGWAFKLARGYCLTGNEKYARAFWKYFEVFNAANPAYRGPHWMNGQEVGIRLAAMVWSLHAFGTARASTVRRKEALVRSIEEHARRVPPTLVYARAQNNNHLVVEAAALYTAGVLLGRGDWRELGWRWLNRALQRQIGPSGEYVQESTNYHRLMLEAALWADAVRRAQGQSWPGQTRIVLERACQWLASMLDPTTGRVPNLGANDGALILPLTSCSFDDFRPTVQAASRAFLTVEGPPGDWDELAVWLGLQPAPENRGSATHAAHRLSGRHSWAYLRASSFKSRLCHMDQLHLDLWWRGLNVARDAGTYLYNADPPWDNPLVSARVHNTVTVDGMDPMTRGGRFLTLDWFPAHSSIILEHVGAELGHMRASHEGYRRLGIRHERAVIAAEDRRWRVDDELIFSRPGRHLLRLHWLLMDGEWNLQQMGNEVRLRLRTTAGRIRLRISGRGFADDFVRVTLVRAARVVSGQGRAAAYDGWFSPTYGSKVPALSLAVEAVSSNSCGFLSEFIVPS